MNPTYRKPVGTLILIVGLAVYAGIVARLFGPVGTLPWYASIPVYALLGVLWLLPTGPLLRWMVTGSWRAPR